MSFLGALPARFRRERVLIVGCGDVGQRAVRVLGSGQRVRLLALTSSAERTPGLRAMGVTPLLGNLDDQRGLRRLAGLATRVLHLAPPPSEAGRALPNDPRTRALAHALMQRAAPRALVYGSTSGVYGDQQGAWVSETTRVQPQSPRAGRRVDAETTVHGLGRVTGLRTTVLRIPGIYAADREGGTPRGRLERGTPVLRESDDVFTNHIHADDLARACVLALWRGKPQRNVNVCDDTEMKMGDYVDFAADLYGVARPPRVSSAEAEAQLPAMLLSFMKESRRLRNSRMKAELGFVLRYPTVREGLKSDPRQASDGLGRGNE
ncbi:NAD(P)-dependent oxidoreductase [Hydrogenophaga crassostreae]|uniref:NAD(P)-dependent oxidoreductase n=1 Tax=Hydrogenophaga crassostreae TaxID=1763535 RepID=A0A167IPN3_9BURK|nr:SDR family oxidoreductase [Hydrogenophaga crassostreae]AOW14605.1 NAD(P)-dependent oxidoreductase [Hydrogenophaga crassostreae]OAD43298.1 NAD(P)-dependent oxidoreductase [Hydrogenophaga crassostreae]